jgi:hypothetical protein
MIEGRIKCDPARFREFVAEAFEPGGGPRRVDAE